MWHIITIWRIVCQYIGTPLNFDHFGNTIAGEIAGIGTGEFPWLRHQQLVATIGARRGGSSAAEKPTCATQNRGFTDQKHFSS